MAFLRQCPCNILSSFAASNYEHVVTLHFRHDSSSWRLLCFQYDLGERSESSPDTLQICNKPREHSKYRTRKNEFAKWAGCTFQLAAMQSRWHNTHRKRGPLVP